MPLVSSQIHPNNRNSQLRRSKAEEPDEDNMEEIDLDNIIPDGRRTRGKQIDYAKAAAEMGPDEDEDEDEDDDFEAPAEDHEMKD